MSKRTQFTTVTPLPDGITRETVLETLHNHIEMIDLNPLVTERHPIRPPPEADAEEFHAQWYNITDKVNYLPGGLYSGAVSFNACFHDLPNGLQTHIYAPMGLDMRGRWTLGGSLPGEPRQPVELGVGIPKTGLWLREDVNMKVNIVMTKFVKGTTKKTHAKLVSRLVEKAHIAEAEAHNNALNEQLSLRESIPPDYHAGLASPTQSQYHPGGPAPAPHPQYFDGKPLNVPYSPQPPPPVIANSTYTPGHTPTQTAQGSHQSYFSPQPQQQPQHPQAQHGYPPDAKHTYSPAPCGSPPLPQQHPAARNQHPTELTTDFAAELPSQDTNTPLELDSRHTRF